MLLLTLASSTLSQSSMVVHKKAGNIVHTISEIDSVTFRDTTATNNEVLLYAIVDSLKTRVEILEEKVAELNILPPPTLSYDKVIKTIQRIGYGDPIQSIVSYKRALKYGFRTLLCDLIFTKDSIPVCFHDIYLNQWIKYVKLPNGEELPDTRIEDNRVYIREKTYQELCDNFDFGLYAGYTGTKVLRLEEMLSLVKNAGIDLYIEVKEMDEKQAQIACRMLQKYGLVNKTSWSGTVNQMKAVVNILPSARVSLMPRQITEKEIGDLVSLKIGKNSVFFFSWNETILNDDILDSLIDNDIEFEMGTIDSIEDLNNYFSRSDAYKYCTGIESNSLLVGKYLYEQNQ